jgi:hypothetical protein
LYVSLDNVNKKLVYKNTEPIIITDTIINSNSFKRVINNKILYIENNRIVRVESKIKSKVLGVNNKTVIYNHLPRVLVLDIECLNIDGKFVPYAVG